MKETCLSILCCAACGSELLIVHKGKSNAVEVREGSIECLSCKQHFPITKGILTLLHDLTQDVMGEKHAMDSKMYYLDTEKSVGITITEKEVREHRDIFLSLPHGNGSAIFQSGGSLQNQAENGNRFVSAVEDLKLTGNERILEVGASFGWGAAYFAQKGCSVVALDITNFLICSDLYFEKYGIYYDRVLADMNKLPFKDESFDIVFANSVLHHCMDLGGIFKELLRVLKKGGKLVAAAECSLGLFEDRDNKAFLPGKEEGRQEKAFRLYEWIFMAKRAGARKVVFSFFSNVDDYIDKKNHRGQTHSFKYTLAAFIQKIPFLKKTIDTLLYPYRWIFRPGNWKLICYR